MSWSLRISDGDLVSSRGSLDVVRNESKLVQDLRNYILEEMGSDVYHPEYGSKLEEESEEVFSDFNRSTLAIESEIRRIANEYQIRQIERAKNDQITRGRVSLDRGEVLISVNNISFQQNLDVLTAVVEIKTGDESSFSFSIEL